MYPSELIPYDPRQEDKKLIHTGLQYKYKYQKADLEGLQTVLQQFEGLFLYYFSKNTCHLAGKLYRIKARLLYNR
jgi:hypothetical protein